MDSYLSRGHHDTEKYKEPHSVFELEFPIAYLMTITVTLGSSLFFFFLYAKVRQKMARRIGYLVRAIAHI